MSWEAQHSLNMREEINRNFSIISSYRGCVWHTPTWQTEHWHRPQGDDDRHAEDEAGHDVGQTCSQWRETDTRHNLISSVFMLTPCLSRDSHTNIHTHNPHLSDGMVVMWLTEQKQVDDELWRSCRRHTDTVTNITCAFLSALTVSNNHSEAPVKHFNNIDHFQLRPQRPLDWHTAGDNPCLNPARPLTPWAERQGSRVQRGRDDILKLLRQPRKMKASLRRTSVFLLTCEESTLWTEMTVCSVSTVNN